MQTFDIKGSKREVGGKKAVKALRAEGKVPCIIYGEGKEGTPFAVPEADFRNLIYTPNVYIVNVDVDGDVKKAVLKDIQFHPLSGKILHVDFLEIRDDKAIELSIPVELQGNSEGVRAGGKLQLEMRKLIVKALPSQMPDRVVVDVTDLGLGKSKKVGELHFDNYEIVNAKSAVVVSVKMTRAARSSADEAAAAK
ncbi:MAG: 50S ribosomal protein L25/general stress protein Ctc [Bacteroidales bacterium]|jgi:large subunit ribosomal protein L25|nr:50S ribosomal protein L25/general stress protein Ctc [Bacteroidales bacterium]